jgi:hypothetical protein
LHNKPGQLQKIINFHISAILLPSSISSNKFRIHPDSGQTSSLRTQIFSMALLGQTGEKFSEPWQWKDCFLANGKYKLSLFPDNQIAVERLMMKQSVACWR